VHGSLKQLKLMKQPTLFASSFLGLIDIEQELYSRTSCQLSATSIFREIHLPPITRDDAATVFEDMNLDLVACPSEPIA